MEMRDSLDYRKGLMNLLRNSNLSLKDLQIAGHALGHHIYNEQYHYAIVKTQPCDPNILGLISDFMIQVDEIWVCIVYTRLQEGIKFSVRSCVREVRADELAAYLAAEAGSGGGHKEKAAGLLKEEKVGENRNEEFSETYFSERMNEYFSEMGKN
jgi:phosphoglycolate phosphatase